MNDVKQALLTKELAYYNSHKSEYLKQYKNSFVVIKNQKFLGAFTTEAQAYEAGLKEFGNQPFLIKQVVEEEVIALHPALSAGVVHVNL